MKKNYSFTGGERGKFYRPPKEISSLEKKISTRPIILDGGMGTSLQDLGLPLDQLPISWNLSQPEKVKQVHLNFIEAGSEIILTNTFTSGRSFLKKDHLDHKQEELMLSGIKISHEAKKESGKNILIGFSLGPCGEKEEYENIFSILEHQNFDFIILETQYHLQEILLALEIYFQSQIKNIPIGLSVTVNEYSKLSDGIDMKELIQKIKNYPLEFLGINCSFGPASMYPAAYSLKQNWSGLTLAKPNKGLPEILDGKMNYSMSDDDFLKWIQKYIDLGIDMIGGCCGVSSKLVNKISSL